ncbi:IMPACT family protein [Aureimonas sp. N4]|uniref:IMPACT family protein n=1 Tax=Aureimonas sp. N4 TaxID=1638165 RepID=UPI00078149AC|nr:YigZ family protein [Aureimonas sp. N4]
MSTLHTLTAASHAQQDIKKSRFLAVANAVSDAEAAQAFLARHADPTAHHNCWAWRIGQTYRFSDDGEPTGTAGKPILQAIDGQGLDRVAVLVTRWFGGIRLGTGGLVRAYGGTAALCLREGEKAPLRDMVAATLTCLFGDLALLQARIAAQAGVEIQATTFSETGAQWLLAVPQDMAETMARLVSDLTHGRAHLRFDD